jgi:N-formylglutamate amidohydrolase
VRLVLHVPHSSRHVPAHERHSLLLSDDALQQELLHMTDAYTDELFSLPHAATVRYPVSRLVADPERFADDAEEVMTKVGMGVIYTKTCCGHPLRQPPSPEERKAILAQYYHPHHQTLTRAVNEALTSSGSCLVIDCHSFPHLPLPYELDRNPVRPDICIGTDEFHTPGALKDVLVSQFTGLGYTVAVNHPFSGALVPSQFYRKDKKVQSAMIEVNRCLYMDESTGTKSGRFDEVRDGLSEVLSMLSQTEYREMDEGSAN